MHTCQTGNQSLRLGQTGAAADAFAAGLAAAEKAADAPVVAKLQLSATEAAMRQNDQRRRARMRRKLGNDQMRSASGVDCTPGGKEAKL